MVTRGEIAEALRRRIVAGEYAPNDKLPSSRELVEEFGCSKTTAQAAIQMLVDEGLASGRSGANARVRKEDEPSLSPQRRLAEVEADLQSAQARTAEVQQQLDALMHQLDAALGRLRR